MVDHSPVKKKKDPFAEFEKMIKKKYHVSDDMYQNMSYYERNKQLKGLLEKNTILIFPKYGLTQLDGMPNFGVIYTDLKDMKETTNKTPREQKLILKQKTDTGLKKPDVSDSEEEDEEKTGGATFDPKMFKGNSELYKHITDY